MVDNRGNFEWPPDLWRGSRDIFDEKTQEDLESC